MKRHRRRLVIKVIGLLLAGAVINVAVAWGCVTTSSAAPIHLNESDAETIFAQYATYDRRAHEVTTFQGNLTHGLGVLFYAVQIGQWDWSEGVDHGTLLFVTKAGFPLRTLDGAWGGGSSEIKSRYLPIPEWFRSTSNELRVLPLLPLWPGFAVNTLFYAAVLWLMFAAPFALRRMIRRRRGRCPACAYPVGSSDVCTECGVALSPRRGAGV